MGIKNTNNEIGTIRNNPEKEGMTMKKHFAIMVAIMAILTCNAAWAQGAPPMPDPEPAPAGDEAEPDPAPTAPASPTATPTEPTMAYIIGPEAMLLANMVLADPACSFLKVCPADAKDCQNGDSLKNISDLVGGMRMAKASKQSLLNMLAMALGTGYDAVNPFNFAVPEMAKRSFDKIEGNGCTAPTNPDGTKAYIAKADGSRPEWTGNCSEQFDVILADTRLMIDAEPNPERKAAAEKVLAVISRYNKLVGADGNVLAPDHWGIKIILAEGARFYLSHETYADSYGLGGTNLFAAATESIENGDETFLGDTLVDPDPDAFNPCDLPRDRKVNVIHSDEEKTAFGLAFTDSNCADDTLVFTDADGDTFEYPVAGFGVEYYLTLKLKPIIRKTIHEKTTIHEEHRYFIGARIAALYTGGFPHGATLPDGLQKDGLSTQGMDLSLRLNFPITEGFSLDVRKSFGSHWALGNTTQGVENVDDRLFFLGGAGLGLNFNVLESLDTNHDLEVSLAGDLLYTANGGGLGGLFRLDATWFPWKHIGFTAGVGFGVMPTEGVALDRQRDGREFTYTNTETWTVSGGIVVRIPELVKITRTPPSTTRVEDE